MAERGNLRKRDSGHAYGGVLEGKEQFVVPGLWGGCKFRKFLPPPRIAAHSLQRGQRAPRRKFSLVKRAPPGCNRALEAPSGVAPAIRRASNVEILGGS